MSYDIVIEQVRALPESCLEDVSKYVQFLLFQYEQQKLEALVETDKEFQQKMGKGYSDMLDGRVTSLAEAVADIKNRYL